MLFRSRALSACFEIHATRTGWDYADSALMARLDMLGVRVDFSALPGQCAWLAVADDRIPVDWHRCPAAPYHPDRADYQSPGTLRLLEVPMTPFRRSVPDMLRQFAWRAAHGTLSPRGVRARFRMLTEEWPDALPEPSPLWAFYFHPDDLAGPGAGRLLRNVERLRALGDVEFVTAGSLAA